jgi:histidine triad (HIT) family protein
MKTIFEKIIDREIPADIIYEDDISMAFLDINPVRKGHILLIPKKLYPWMADVPDELLGKLFIQSKKLMQVLLKAFQCDYVHVIVEGIEVPHFHIHLIPSRLEEKNATFHHEIYLEGEKNSILEKIKNAL